MILSFNGIELNSQAASEPLQRKIVVFKPDISDDLFQEKLIQRIGGEKYKNLRLINAKAVLLSKKAEKELIRGDNILRIDDDVEVSALGESLPWGIDKIDAEKVWPLGNAGNGVKVGIIDTGISNRHPDLLANVKGGINIINPLKNWNDDNGHGSHVAGIVGQLTMKSA